MNKRIPQVVLLALLVLSGAAMFLSRSSTDTTGEAASPDLAISGTQVLYLHGTFRCETCNSLEEQAQRAISEDFAEEIGTGTLSWASLNIDKDEYAPLGTAFELTSSSLVLSDGGGAEGRWKVLERTWELVGDPVAFREYVSSETRSFLRGSH